MSKYDSCPENIALPVEVQEDLEWSDVVRNPKTPFIHKFETAQNKHIYDVNTSKVLHVDPVIWDIISDFETLKKEQIVSKYSVRHNADNISTAFNNILEAQQKRGLFLSKRPEIVMPLCEKDIKQKLNNECKMLTLEVTENCNFRCSYCVYGGTYTHRRRHSSRYMNWSIAKKAIDDFLSNVNNVEEPLAITFYGGEPLLNFSLIKKCVRYVRDTERGDEIIFSLATNGSLLRDKVAAFLASEGFLFSVSLDGPQEIHDRCRRSKDGSPTWKLVTSNMRNFLRKYPQYKTNSKLAFTVVMVPPLDVRELEEFFKSSDIYYDKINIRLTTVSPIGATAPPVGNIKGIETMYNKFIENLISGKINDKPFGVEHSLERSLFEPPFLFFHKRFDIFGRWCPHCQESIASLPEKFCSISTCVPGARRLFVTIGGDYKVCERVPESDYMKIGNIEKGLDVPKIRQLLEDWVVFSKDQCKYCWRLSTCQVGCLSNVNDGEKPTRRTKLAQCAASRLLGHKMLVDYYSIFEKNPHAFDYMKNITIH